MGNLTMDMHNIAYAILATGYILMFVTPAAKPARVYVQQVIVGAVLGSSRVHIPFGQRR
jgi:hypothetical protein